MTAATAAFTIAASSRNPSANNNHMSGHSLRSHAELLVGYNHPLLAIPQLWTSSNCKLQTPALQLNHAPA
jgi:hypothetical protein